MSSFASKARHYFARAHESASRPKLAPIVTMAAVVLPALLFVVAGYERRWAGDDGLINFRVVRQLMAGNGFVYNAGERTESVTSAAWVMLLWLVGELGFDLPTAAWVLGLLFSFVGLSMAGLASTRLHTRDGEQTTLVLPLGVLAYAAIPVAWDYATSALENGLGLAFLGTMYWLMARVAHDRTVGRPRAIATFCGLAPLIRPDFALYAAPMLLILMFVAHGRRVRAWVVACAALPGLVYEVFRMGYFACLVPNTAIAKEAFASRWDQGLYFLDNTVGAYALVVPLTCCAVAWVATWWRLLRTPEAMRAWVSGSLACAGILHILYVVRLGGDFMHGRMLLPGLFAVFAAAGVQRVNGSSTSSKRSVEHTREASTAGSARAERAAVVTRVLTWAPVLVVACWAVYCATSLRGERHLPTIQDERSFYVESSGEAHPLRTEDYTKHIFYGGPLSIRKRISVSCPWGDASMDDQARELCPRFALPDGSDGMLTDWPSDVLIPLEPTSTAPFVVGVLGFRPLGIAGLVVGLRMNVVDSFGLADAVASRMTLGARGRPGHEKFFPTPWFAGKYLAAGSTTDPRAITARRVLHCGLLGELYAATHEPMSVRRFVRNMALAFPLHRLRIPAEPSEAERLFCN